MLGPPLHCGIFIVLFIGNILIDQLADRAIAQIPGHTLHIFAIHLGIEDIVELLIHHRLSGDLLLHITQLGLFFLDLHLELDAGGDHVAGDIDSGDDQ